jgi:hypothetical protein
MIRDPDDFTTFTTATFGGGVMSTLVGFGTFSGLLEERISEKVSRRILSGDQDDCVVEHRSRCPC